MRKNLSAASAKALDNQVLVSAVVQC